MHHLWLANRDALAGVESCWRRDMMRRKRGADDIARGGGAPVAGALRGGGAGRGTLMRRISVRQMCSAWPLLVIRSGFHRNLFARPSVATRYFAAYPEHALHSSEVVRRMDWPARLRDRLSRELDRAKSSLPFSG